MTNLSLLMFLVDARIAEICGQTYDNKAFTDADIIFLKDCGISLTDN